MSVFKRGEIYWYEFMFNGERIRESTKQGNANVARQMESAHRTSLAKGEVGIRERKKAPKLAAFLLGEFTAYIETKHASKPATIKYYKRGAKSLAETHLGELRLDEITSQHMSQYAALKAGLAVITINAALRVLRRALRLAVQWGTIPACPKVELLKGEKHRERVLSRDEQAKYLAACAEPWRTIAILLLGTGLRPSEALGLTWANVQLAARTIFVSEGKTKAARRRIPMREAVYQALRAHWEAAGEPNQAAWVFPSSRITTGAQGTSYFMHEAALKASGVEPFVPYTMRHTALTELGESGCDVFTLGKIAGHTSIAITQRYVHPQAEAVANAFAKWDSPHKTPHTVEITVGRKRQLRNKSVA